MRCPSEGDHSSLLNPELQQLKGLVGLFGTCVTLSSEPEASVALRERERA